MALGIQGIVRGVFMQISGAQFESFAWEIILDQIHDNVLKMMILTGGNIHGFDYFPKMLTFNFDKSAILFYFKKVVVKLWNGSLGCCFEIGEHS